MPFYLPTHRTQRVAPTADPYARVGCAAYTGAMLLDAATEGEVRVSGLTFRQRSGEYPPDPKSPGLNAEQVAGTLVRLGVKAAKYERGLPWAKVAGLARDHFLGLTIHYGTVDPALRFSRTFTGWHMIAIGAVDAAGVARVYDPLAYHSISAPLDAYRGAYTYGDTLQLASVPAVSITPAERTYRVRRGDTLWDIAEAFYGDGRKWGRIASANAIRDPRTLRVGAVLTIP